jgi:hypothetical protein
MTDLTIRPFEIHVPDEHLAELQRRIAATRRPSKETVADRSQGVQLATIQNLVTYWGNGYDWRTCEAQLSALPQLTTEIDGLGIHFIHVKSRHENALPLIITQGWPGSVIEMLGVIGPRPDRPVPGGDLVPGRAHLPAHPHPGQRPARLRRLPVPSPARRRASKQSAGTQPHRQPHPGDDPLRSHAAAPLRPAAQLTGLRHGEDPKACPARSLAGRTTGYARPSQQKSPRPMAPRAAGRGAVIWPLAGLSAVPVWPIV